MKHKALVLFLVAPLLVAQIGRVDEPVTPLSALPSQINTRIVASMNAALSAITIALAGKVSTADLATGLAGKVNTTDVRLTDARTPVVPTPTTLGGVNSGQCTTGTGKLMGFDTSGARICEADAGGFVNPMDSPGQLIYGGLAGDATALASGTGFLKMNGTSAPTIAFPTATDVGLANVDNTSDASKPVSTATQTALNAKQATISGAPGTWPSLATVATTGSYSDLSSTPTLAANTTATTSNFFTAYNSTTGAFTKAQPACANISDAGTACTATIASYAPLISPSFTTPTLGVALATSINGTSIPSSSTLVTTAAGNIAGTAAGLSGTPALPNGTTATTQTAADASTKVSTTAYVDTGLALKSNLASPTFTGTPLSTTAAADTNTTQIATTAFYIGQKGTANPVIAGTAAPGTSAKFSPIDHVHPVDTSRAAASATATVNSQTLTLGTTNTITADPTSTRYKTRVCEIHIWGTGAAGVLQDADDEAASCYNGFGATETITAVTCYANAGSPTVTPIITGGGTILSSALTCGTTSFAAGSLSGSPTLASAGAIDANITTAGGTATNIRLVFTLTR
jgi:hypothetical protein